MSAEGWEMIDTIQEISAGSDTGRLFWCTQIFVLMQDMELRFVSCKENLPLRRRNRQTLFFRMKVRAASTGFPDTVQPSEPGLWFYWVCDCETR